MEQRAVDRARRLRQEMSGVENVVWEQVRDRRAHGLKFRRQVPIGPYVVDFACFSERLVVELDGPHHLATVDRDADRQDWLESQGFRVLRFAAVDIDRHPDLVPLALRGWMATPPPHPALPGKRGG